jgi:MFS family permease
MQMRRAKPYYGWYIVLTLAATTLISYGILYYAIFVFMSPMGAEMGWTSSEMTGAYSLSLLVTGLMAYPVGAWIDRHGARWLMAAGSTAACVLVLAWSQVTTLTGLYIVWVGIGICAAAVYYEPAFALTAQWFRAQRGKALTAITLVAGLASTIFLPLCDALLHAYGWRTATAILGIFLGAITIPLHLFMLRNRPAELGLEPDGGALPASGQATPTGGIAFRQALNGRLFWLLVLGFGLASIGAAGIRVHFIPYLQSVGIDATLAAYTTGTIGFMQVVGRALFAPLERRFTSRDILVGVLVLQAMALGLLLFGASPLLLVVSIGIFGASQGMFTLSRPLLVAEVYGVAHYGRISSVMALLLTGTSTAAPLAAALLFDAYGTYSPVVWGVVILSLGAVGVALLARRAALPAPEGAPALQGIGD